MNESRAIEEDPRLGRILYAFEPPSLFQMVAGLIGFAVGLGLYMAMGMVLRKLTLTIAGLGAAAFAIGLWRYSERVEFGERGLRRRKWAGSTELLYEEIGAVTRQKSESLDVYSSLTVEPSDIGKRKIEFYRFEDAGYPDAVRGMAAKIADAAERRLGHGEPFDWISGVRIRREGLELTSAGSAQLIPYRDVGDWKAGQDAGTLTLHTRSGDPLFTTSLDGRNFIVCYELLARLKG
jgi:hypothetical protein